MEIGSEFWLDRTEYSLNIEVDLTDYTPNIEVEWLKRYGNYNLTSSGREAIYLLLQEITPKNKSVLLPSYICDSVIIPFLDCGYHCYFYDVNNNLCPVPDSIKKYKDVGIFFHLGYFGFPTNVVLNNFIKELKKNSTIIVEDITHSLFSNNGVNDENDYYIASIRKWMGLPSGGFLASSKVIQSPMKIEDTNFSVIRREAMIQKANYIHNQNNLQYENHFHKSKTKIKSEINELFHKGEAVLAEEYSSYSHSIDSLSCKIICSVDLSLIRKKRKENYEMLEKSIKIFPDIKPVFSRISAQVCPLFFPVYINNRNEVQTYLAKNEIYCPIHWPIPRQVQQISQKDKMESAFIYHHIISIPCDQRYGINDMKRIITVLKSIYPQNNK